jgi:single-stranded-DNA-specific exonuclease
LLAPFGQGNPEPVFLLSKIIHRRAARQFGRNHLEMFLKAGENECRAVAFNLASHGVPPEGHYLAGMIDWDDYRNRVYLRVVDWCDESAFSSFSISNKNKNHE